MDDVALLGQNSAALHVVASDLRGELLEVIELPVGVKLRVGVRNFSYDLVLHQPCEHDFKHFFFDLLVHFNCLLNPVNQVSEAQIFDPEVEEVLFNA